MKDGAAAQKKIKKRTEGDYWIIFLTLLLSLFGLLMVFSASYYVALSKKNDAFYYLKDDLKWMALGWAAFAVFASFDYHRWRKYGRLALIIGVILLLLIFTPMGLTINNATRWLNFKLFTVMPGEVIKTCLVLFLARFYSDDPSRIKSFSKGIAPVGVITLVCCFLIYKQPNLSTAGIVAMLVLGIMISAGLSLIWVFGGIAAGGAALAAALMSPKGAYMLERVVTFMDPFKDAQGSGYQVVQSLLALGSGGITGVGLGKSVQKTLYLPEPQSDFILAIIGEELGLIGLIALLCVFLALIWRCFSAAIKAQDYFGMLLASGIALHLAIQVVLNVAIVSAAFFPTGVVLPFISLGGNATTLYLAEMGIIYNISKRRDALSEEPLKGVTP